MKYKCRFCGFLMQDADSDCPQCAEDNIFSSGQTIERQIIRDRISKVIPSNSDEKKDN